VTAASARTVPLVEVGRTGIETTILGFGTATLLAAPNAERQRLLATAVDVGIRHFDVAPIYGLGHAERVVGEFARGRRDSVVLATKFGIEPTAAARILAHAQQPLQRRARSRGRGSDGAPPHDARSGVVGAALYRAPGYDAPSARASLERSLRSLRTDYLDIVYLHDPHVGDVRSNDVGAYLESAVTDGLVRSWGVAGEPAGVVDAVDRLGGSVPIVQLRDDVFLRTRSRLRLATPTILFGMLARALPRILAHVGRDARTLRRWRDELGVDAANADVMASLLLRDAWRENDGGPILFATTQAQRVVAAAEAAMLAPTPDPVLDAFRRLVETELRAQRAHA
jgi:D-threo-aldose 1-dehydrogenase